MPDMKQGEKNLQCLDFTTIKTNLPLLSQEINLFGFVLYKIGLITTSIIKVAQIKIIFPNPSEGTAVVEPLIYHRHNGGGSPTNNTTKHTILDFPDGHYLPPLTSLTYTSNSTVINAMTILYGYTMTDQD